MKILMTADTVGGVWTYAIELAASLARAGVMIELATFGRMPSSEQAAQVTALPNVRLHPRAYKLEWMNEPWDDIDSAGDWLLALERELEPDVIHLNGFVHGQLPWHRPVLVVAHSCVCSWWRAVKGVDAPASWDRYRREVSRGLRAVEFVVAPTRAMLDAIESHYGRLRASEVIPNGRGSARFGPREAEPMIFAAGRAWDEAKNIAALDAVAGDLNWPVFLAGEQSHPDRSRKVELRAVNALGALSSDEVAHWLGRAAIYALPARYEPFGLSALEAALSGCALVLGDIASLREVWGDSATYVPPDDQHALRRALEQLIQDDGHRKRMSRRARERAAHYTPFAMAARYMSVYRRLLDRRSPRCPAAASSARWAAVPMDRAGRE